jgi:hypothetical protein
VFFAEAAVDPTLNLSGFTWSNAVRTILFWTWFFLAWAATYLAEADWNELDEVRIAGERGRQRQHQILRDPEDQSEPNDRSDALATQHLEAVAAAQCLGVGRVEWQTCHSRRKMPAAAAFVDCRSAAVFRRSPAAAAAWRHDAAPHRQAAS